MYWIWQEKPERNYCCEVSGRLNVEPRDIPKIGPQLVSDKPLEVPFPGFVIEKLNDHYYKGPPRPLGDYLESGSSYLVSARLRSVLTANGVMAEYFAAEMKAKVIEAVQKYYYLRLLPSIECLDREKSEFTEWPEDAGGGINQVFKLVIDESVIPKGMPMLRMSELHVILVSNTLKKAIEGGDISCVHFITEEEYPKSHEIYGDLVRETTKKP